MPDSSEIGLGQNTRVHVAAFNDMRNGPGTSITVENGALKFDIRHPSGKKANYRFITPTSQIGVRGTIGLIATTLTASGPTTTVACVSVVSFTATDRRHDPRGRRRSQALSVVGGTATTTTVSSVVGQFQSAGISNPTGPGAGVSSGGSSGSSTSSSEQLIFLKQLLIER